MTYFFDRRALLLPLAVPLAAGLLIGLLSTLLSLTWDSLILGYLLWVAAAGAVYAIPYLVILILIYPRVDSWTRLQLWKAAIGYGLLTAVVPLLYVAVVTGAQGSLTGDILYVAGVCAGFAVVYVVLVVAIGELCGRQLQRRRERSAGASVPSQ